MVNPTLATILDGDQLLRLVRHLWHLMGFGHKETQVATDFLLHASCELMVGVILYVVFLWLL